MAVPDKIGLLHMIDERADTLDRLADRLVDGLRIKVSSASRSIEALSPIARLTAMRNKLEGARGLIESKMTSALEQKKILLGGAVSRLEDVNPLAVLKRGYSMTLDENGGVVTQSEQIAIGDGISVILSDGLIKAKVEEIENGRK
jgi:exodeoxyribonuclease VII large subunit